MKRHLYYSLALIAVLLAVPYFANAAFLQSPTRSFGGRVLTSSLPIATCIGFGTGPVVLTNNVGSLISAATPNNPAAATTSNIYGSIPYYANLTLGGGGFYSPLPQSGDWILGRASIVPAFERCFISGTPIPFPVRNTNLYNVSR